ncbi:MAG: isoprenylcysteine carboxylmethyltransferase family protein [Oscillospiraceae bacterium]|nr:isoprenylcysteine carboxylmethyltransferase family protein [Oscillospiraceae bacterium]
MALLLWLAFYAAYLLKMLLLRRQGIAGNLLGKDAREKALVVVTYGGAAAQVISILWPRLLWALPTLPIAQGLGLLLMLGCVAAFVAAILTMRDNWRAGFGEGQQTRLVTGGVYRLSRNPAFLGFDLLYLGCTLACPTALNLLVTAAALPLFHLQILAEERFLAQAFGQEYLQYKKHTARYFGWKQ